MQLQYILVNKGINKFLNLHQGLAKVIWDTSWKSHHSSFFKQNANKNLEVNLSRLCRLLSHFPTFSTPLCSLKPCSWLRSLSYSTLKLMSSTCGKSTNEVLQRDHCIVEINSKNPFVKQTYLYNTNRTKTLFDGLFCHRGRKIGHKHLICLIFFSFKRKQWIKSIIYYYKLICKRLNNQKLVLRNSFSIL